MSIFSLASALKKPIRSSVVAWLACFATGSVCDPRSAAGGGIASDVTFYKVPLVCGAAPHIGCGSKAKPVLLELEARRGDIAEAWLNRAGTLIVVVWNGSSGADGRGQIVNAVFEKNNMTANEVRGKEYKKLLKEFQSRKGWLRGADVNTLSEEEAEVIAERLVGRISAKTPLGKERAEALRSKFAGVLKKRFNRNYLSKINSDEANTGRSLKEEIESELLKIGKEHLNETEWKALKEALALGMRPTEEESKDTQPADPER